MEPKEEKSQDPLPAATSKETIIKERTPVAEKPIPNPDAPPAFVSPPLPATTTAAQDITLAGQRRINLIWEVTQAVIASTVTLAVIFLAFEEKENQNLVIAFFTIITAYITRTNHQAIGGVGAKATDTQSYLGR